MSLIDTHAHLDLPDFDPDRDQVLARAREAGVVQIVTIGLNPESAAQAVALAQAHDPVWAAVGWHPHQAREVTPEGLDRLRELARGPKVVAFGEIGLDFYRNLSPPQVQEERLDDLIHLGLDLGLPLIIHDREAHARILDRLAAAGAGQNGGVIHCFSGDYPLARRFLDLGFHLGIPGPVTFPRAEALQEVVARVPLEALLVETDAPFLAPVPKRGRRNEPAYVRFTAAEVARIRGLSLEEVAEATSKNARALFGLPEPGP